MKVDEEDNHQAAFAWALGIDAARAFNTLNEQFWLAERDGRDWICSGSSCDDRTHLLFPARQARCRRKILGPEPASAMARRIICAPALAVGDARSHAVLDANDMH
jgi:hypothetical protein